MINTLVFIKLSYKSLLHQPRHTKHFIQQLLAEKQGRWCTDLALGGIFHIKTNGIADQPRISSNNLPTPGGKKEIEE